MSAKQELIKAILNEIDSLPPISENIKTIRTLINDPKSNVHTISEPIKRDPSLAAEVLKLANSPSYMAKAQIDSIDKAVSLIGLRQLSSILLSIDVKKILEDSFEDIEEIWSHSYKCAFYAQFLMKMTAFAAEVDSAYTAGLLHDIGKIILLTITPDLIHRISALGSVKSFSIPDMEKIAIGLDHAEAGERLALKWGFPPKLTSAIGNHHSPILATKDSVPLVYSVYLANILCRTTEFSVELSMNIEQKVLNFFSINSEKKLESVIHTLNDFYISVSDNQKFL